MGRIADILTNDDAVAFMKEAGLHVIADPMDECYCGYMDHPALVGGTDYVVKWEPVFQSLNLYTEVNRLSDDGTGVPRFCFRIPKMQKPIITTEQFYDVIKNLKKILDKNYVEIYNVNIEKALEALD
jgi:hypothetical protein